MALDMESEFLKLAKNILSNPQQLYKMMALHEKDMRVSVMGVEGFLIFPSRFFEEVLSSMKNRREIGRRLGKNFFEGFMEEYSFELENLPKRDVLDVAISLSRTSGYGDFRVKWGKLKREFFKIEVREGLGDEEFIAGFVEGLMMAVLKADKVEEVSIRREGGVTLLEGRVRRK
ncbi:MAG: hypothetical protein J7L88_00465 [Thermoplasmata archaeon]|nr:hypothetical protein [Thermoplasmata archaeon]